MNIPIRDPAMLHPTRCGGSPLPMELAFRKVADLVGLTNWRIQADPRTAETTSIMLPYAAPIGERRPIRSAYRRPKEKLSRGSEERLILFGFFI